MPIGTIHQYLNTMKLQQRWRMRQQGLEEPKQGMLSGTRTGAAASAGPGEKLMRATILSKLKAGKRLAVSELIWLWEHDPLLYGKAQQAERDRQAHQQELRRCRSRQEARKAHSARIASIALSAVGTVKGAATAGSRMEALEGSELRQAAVRDEFATFRRGATWEKLPEREKKKDRRHGPGRSV